MWSRDAVTSSARRSQFRVPRHDRSLLTVPPWSEVPRLVLRNASRLSELSQSIGGTALASLRAAARTEILHAAVDYTCELTGTTFPGPLTGPLIVTGHQPELFHAGVWAKNFAAAGAARVTRGIALNLIIDNDTVSSRQIRVPLGSRTHPMLTSVPFDTSQPQQPWEEARIADLACFQSFGQRVTEQIQSAWHYEPLAHTAWPVAREHSAQSGSLVNALVACRHAIERNFGVSVLEVPMSRVCQTPSFTRFAAALLLELPAVHADYNAAVTGYRQSHRLRSTTHPVPRLENHDGWLEAPFWVWRSGSQRRERPFVRRQGKFLALRAGETLLAEFPATTDGVATGLLELPERNLRLRTRALTTTLFARLVLADLFLHGIGGAKYDEMTDQIVAKWLNVEPPPFATVSATVHLPLATPFGVTPDALRKLDHSVTDFRFNPERAGGGISEDLMPLVAEKQQLIAGLGGRRPTRQEHRRLESLRIAIAAGRQERLADLQAAQRRCHAEWAADQILTSREFSWCLHSSDRLQAFFGENLLTDGT